MTRLNYARAVALTASITASSVLSGAVVSAFYRSAGFYREKTVRHTYSVTRDLAGTKEYSNSYPDEKAHTKPLPTSMPALAFHIWPDPKITPTHTPDEKTHADASSNEYANLNQHTNANTYRSPDISAATNPHTNSDKVAYADAHAYEYATP